MCERERGGGNERERTFPWPSLGILVAAAQVPPSSSFLLLRNFFEIILKYSNINIYSFYGYIDGILLSSQKRYFFLGKQLLRCCVSSLPSPSLSLHSPLSLPPPSLPPLLSSLPSSPLPLTPSTQRKTARRHRRHTHMFGAGPLATSKWALLASPM